LSRATALQSDPADLASRCKSPWQCTRLSEFRKSESLRGCCDAISPESKQAGMIDGLGLVETVEI